jgi:hypothetical protein
MKEGKPFQLVETSSQTRPRVFLAAPVTMLHMNKTFAILPERMDSKETSNYNKRSLNCNSSLLVKTL